MTDYRLSAWTNGNCKGSGNVVNARVGDATVCVICGRSVRVRYAPRSASHVYPIHKAIAPARARRSA